MTSDCPALVDGVYSRSAACRSPTRRHTRRPTITAWVEPLRWHPARLQTIAQDLDIRYPTSIEVDPVQFKVNLRRTKSVILAVRYHPDAWSFADETSLAVPLEERTFDHSRGYPAAASKNETFSMRAYCSGHRSRHKKKVKNLHPCGLPLMNRSRSAHTCTPHLINNTLPSVEHWDGMHSLLPGDHERAASVGVRARGACNPLCKPRALEYMMDPEVVSACCAPLPAAGFTS